MGELRLEWIDPKTLTPNPANWRRHPKAQKDALEAVIGEVGWAGALLFNERTNRLIDGHLRQEISHDGPVPVLVGSWSEEQERLILATLDPIAALAEAESDALDALLKTVETESEAVKALLERLAADEGIDLGGEPVADPGAQVDRAAELQEKWQVETGQIWECGGHCIICGDCREPDTWAQLLGAAQVENVNGVFTSPPYAEQRKKQYGGVPVGEYVDWWEAVQKNTRANLAGDGSFFVNIKPHAKDKQRSLYVFDLVTAMVRKWQWLFVDEFCWLRSGIPQQVVNRFKNQFEPVYWFANTPGYKFLPGNVMHYSDSVPIALGPGAGDTNAARRQGRVGAIQGNEIRPGLAYPGNVLKGMHQKEVLGHAATFPIALPDFFIRAYSDEGDAWLDPFLGSGTTIVAAHQNGRRGLGIEVLPRYCAVTLERLSQMGLEPRRVE